VRSERSTGLGGVPVIDATNLFHGGLPAEFDSLAAYVKSLTSGPVAKAFNTNFAALYGRIGEARVRPSMVFVSDDDARGATETLIRDAGFEPAYAGDLGAARAFEDSLGIIFALSRQRGPFVYRIGGPDELQSRPAARATNLSKAPWSNLTCPDSSRTSAK
jgi:8-hydroxy-5-deazaflavin:NADPH oxidoreductase